MLYFIYICAHARVILLYTENDRCMHYACDILYQITCTKVRPSSRYVYLTIPAPPSPLRRVSDLPKPYPQPRPPKPAWGFPASRACRGGRADRGWGRARTTPGPNPPGRLGCATEFCFLSLLTRRARCATSATPCITQSQQQASHD